MIKILKGVFFPDSANLVFKSAFYFSRSLKKIPSSNNNKTPVAHLGKNQKKVVNKKAIFDKDDSNIKQVNKTHIFFYDV